jgi:cell division transport system ATP-binding protein
MKSVSKIYGNNVTALSNISFSISKGEFVFVVGPSGAGKSTLVKMIYREETPTSGIVVVNGVDLGRMRRRDVPRLRRTIGVVFQDFKLLPDRTVFENVAFALRVIEASKREIRRKVPAVLEMVGLGERSSDMPHHLSGGEQQRVALARAVVNNPSVIIADEPTGNLDPDTSWGIVALLSEVNRRGTTVIMATHDKPIVDSMRKRVIQMEGGSVVRDTPHGVYGHAV